MIKVPSHIRHLLCAFVVGLVLSSCNNKSVSQSGATSLPLDSLIPKYSQSFRINYYKGFKLVQVFANKKLISTYILYTDSATVPAVFSNAIKIKYPAKRIVCMSTTHIGAMELLDDRKIIVAATNKDFIYDSIVRAMISAGSIKNIGKDYQPDYELIAQSKPDLLFSDGENGTSQMNAKLHALGIKIVSSRDYFEQEPLARAEWINFFAAFVGQEKLADSIFKVVASNYEAGKKRLKSAEHKPTVFCNLPYSGVWYMPCGKNYVAKLITDAGGNFLWNEAEPANGLNLTLNFEQVYESAANADIWININTCTNLNQIATTDVKFKLFKAFKTAQVYNCTRRMSPGGMFDLWETGAFRPDIVLSDLGTIFHPKDSIHTLYYYERLK